MFPDDEALVQAEFERNLPFAKSVARSAPDPDDPKSSLGIKTKPFYIKSDDPYKDGIPGANFTFKYSYGDPQPVAVLAKRALGKVTLKYRINGGRTHSARDVRVEGRRAVQPGRHLLPPGPRHGAGHRPGRLRRVWFEGQAASASDRRSPTRPCRRPATACSWSRPRTTPAPRRCRPGGPHYAQVLPDALAANGQPPTCTTSTRAGGWRPTSSACSATTTPCLVHGRRRHHPQGGLGPGNADRLALDEVLEIRAYMNEGGRVLYTGKNSGQQYSANAGTQLYDPKGEGPCNPLPTDIDPRRCLALRGSGDGDERRARVLVRRLRATRRRRRRARTASIFDVLGIDDPFSGLTRGASTVPTAPTTRTTAGSFIATSGILPADGVPAVRELGVVEVRQARRAVRRRTPASEYVYSQIADVSYKRLTREIAVPAGGGNLTFWTSYDTEARLGPPVRRGPDRRRQTTGRRCPDANGHTNHETGDSCPEGWRELHPYLAHYQTWDGGRDLHADRHDRRVERRLRQLRRLAAVAIDLGATPARRSRSRSPTRATGRPRTSACSSTT